MNSYGKIQFPHNGEMASFILTKPFGPALDNGYFHEQYTSLTFLELLREGDTVIDVGASIGYYTLLSFAAMRGKGRIISFEPNPFSYAKFARHIAVNEASCVVAFNAALSDAVGTARILANKKDSGLSRILAQDDRGDSEDDVVVSCTTLCLDDIIEDMGIADVRLMKIDAEGHEEHVIRGAHQTLLRRIPEYVVCEINRGELLRNGFGEIPLRQIFEKYGYTAEIINNISQDICGGKIRKPYPLHDMAQTNHVFNILFRRV